MTSPRHVLLFVVASFALSACIDNGCNNDGVEPPPAPAPSPSGGSTCAVAGGTCRGAFSSTCPAGTHSDPKFSCSGIFNGSCCMPGLPDCTDVGGTCTRKCGPDQSGIDAICGGAASCCRTQTFPPFPAPSVPVNGRCNGVACPASCTCRGEKEDAGTCIAKCDCATNVDGGDAADAADVDATVEDDAGDGGAACGAITCGANCFCSSAGDSACMCPSSCL